ncbi:MAG: LacI family DNA-binding transcriptional regulator [Janthinobacterium lividum]
MALKLATIKDVAQASGVSTATVSYVLNNGPKRVVPATRARVQAAIDKLQYYPSTMARGLGQKRLDCLGVVFPQPNPGLVSDSYFSAILDGIIQIATERRQNVTLYTGLEWQGVESLPAFRDRRVDGLLLVAVLTDSEMVPALTEAGLPFVLINGTSPDPRVSSVDIDNIEASGQAVRHLAELGHRRIALLGGQPNSPSSAPRRAGFLQAMQELGLPVDDSLLLEGFYTREWGRKGMARLLSLPEPPTAVFAGGDGIAAGAYLACTDAGISIPHQMSIVGFDDAPYARELLPALTTVRHPLMKIGYTAATVLLDRLDKAADDVLSGEQVVLCGELVVRGSTAVPPARPS